VNAPVVALPDRTPPFSWVRARSLLAGTGFLLAVTGVINLSWLFQLLFWYVPPLGLVEAVRRVAPIVWVNALATLPSQPVAAAILNLAPSAGWRRSAYFAAAYAWIVSWCWCVAPAGPFSHLGTAGLLHSPRWWASQLEASILAALKLWAFAYYRAVSRASGVLIRAQIDAATRETELQQARLHLLRAQIEPHFLFNTLATVRTLARSERVAAVQLIDNLMRYVGAALPKLRQEASTLEDEMQLIDAYLGIYRVRMGVRLSHEIVLPPELATVRIPPMILLTLVENALKHGINPAVEGGFIRVSALRERSVLVLKVADSGCGIGAQHGHGIGLSNVRVRLMTRYGDEATLSLAQAEPRGVVATIRIPGSALP
jgi:signal transduction histidine kinase